MKVDNTIDLIRTKSNLRKNKTTRFIKNHFYTMLGFTQSHLGPLGDVEGFVQLIPGTYKSDKPINFTGIDEVHLKCDCNTGSIVNGIREQTLQSFALSSPTGHELYKKPRNKLFKKLNKPVLSHLTFCSEDDDHKTVNVNRETIRFTCQIIKI